jgi:hypothetical protein
MATVSLDEKDLKTLIQLLNSVDVQTTGAMREIVSLEEKLVAAQNGKGG